jgi:hypothetical protein
MGELSSKLFTEGDPAAVRKLDDCAAGRPSEVQSHFTQGHSSGEAVRKLQLALKNAKDNDTIGEFDGMPDFSVNGQYDKAFADAIEFYKGVRGIKNYAGKIDRIVGIKTIHELDKEATKRKQVDPDPRPVPKPGEHKRAMKNCVPEDEVPLSQLFSVRMLLYASGGEGVELSKYWFAVRDKTNGLSALYIMTGIGLGTPSPIPGQGSAAGAPTKDFSTVPAKVTDFVWCQIGSATHPPPFDSILTISAITMQYKGEDGKTHIAGPMTIDTGPINLPGAGFQTGPWSILSLCHGKPGATRHEISNNDIIFG